MSSAQEPEANKAKSEPEQNATEANLQSSLTEDIEETNSAQPANETGIVESAPSPPPVAGVDETVHLPERDPAALRIAQGDEGGQRRRAVDVVLVGLTLLLAFLLSSFAIANSDFWLHLATGRFLTSNFTSIGVDPFTFTAADVLWVNHSWLYDLLIFSLYNLDSGAGIALVVAKGAIVVLLALVMLQTQERQGSLWIAVFCVTLALIAMSQFLTCRPRLVSMLFVAVTFHLLMRSPAERDGKYSFAHLWFLPVLFVLWVNVDRWFVFGPLLVGLTMLGDGVQRLITFDRKAPATDGSNRLKVLGMVFVAGLLACLVNPYFHNALRLPVELGYLLSKSGLTLPFGLGGGAEALRAFEATDPGYVRFLSLNLWSPGFFEQIRLGQDIPRLCFVLMLCISFVSFVALLIAGKEIEANNYVVARFIVWAALASLSVSQFVLLPLFVIVAACITTRNWQEVAERFGGMTGTGRQALNVWRAIGRAATGVALLGLILLVWPGWLRSRFGNENSRFRVSWSITADGGFKDIALELGKLKKEKKINRIYNVDTRLGSYLAFFSPQGGEHVPYALDSRHDLFESNAKDLSQVRFSLLPNTFKALQEAPAAAVQKKESNDPKNIQMALRARNAFFTKHKVTNVAFRQSAATIVSRVDEALLAKNDRWRFVQGNGRAAIYRWWPNAKEAAQATDTDVGADHDERAFSKKHSPPWPPKGIYFPTARDPIGRFLFGNKNSAERLQQVNFYIRRHQLLTKQTLDDFRPQFKKNNEAIDNFTNEFGQRVSKQLIPAAVGLFCLHMNPMPGASSFTACFGFAQFSHLQQDVLVAVDKSMKKKQPKLTDITYNLSFPLLAVREGRRAARSDPRNPFSYFALAKGVSNQLIVEQFFCEPQTHPLNKHNLEMAQKYMTDYHVEPAQYWQFAASQMRLSLRYNLRTITRIAAYRNALILDPDDARVHWLMAVHYGRPQSLVFFPRRVMFFDEALRHLTKAKEILDGATNLDKALAQLRADIAKQHAALTKSLNDREKHFQAHLSAKPLTQKILGTLWSVFRTQKLRDGSKRQLELGLGRKALDIAQAAKWQTLSKSERTQMFIVKLELLMALGRMKEVHQLLELEKQHEREQKVDLVPLEVELLFRLHLAAVAGDYESFDLFAGTLEEGPVQRIEESYLHQILPLQMIGMQHPVCFTVPLLRAIDKRGFKKNWRQSQDEPIMQSRRALGEFVQYRFLRGLNALEAGKVAAAEKHFREVLSVQKRCFPMDPNQHVFPFNELRLAQEYLREIERVNGKQ